MIARSTRSRTRRLSGTGLAAGLIVSGLALTASGSVAAPSRIAPKAAQPLFRSSTEQSTDTNGRTTTTSRTVIVRTADADDVAMPIPPVPPVPPVAPMAPVVPVKWGASMAPIPPVPPIPPIPPVPPVPPVSDEATPAARAAAEAGARAAAAGARAAAEGERIAAATLARLDIGRMVEASLEQARAGMEAACGGQPAQAHGCVDVAAINREVADSLEEAAEEVRNDPDIPTAIRARILAQLSRAAAGTRQKLH